MWIHFKIIFKLVDFYRYCSTTCADRISHSTPLEFSIEETYDITITKTGESFIDVPKVYQGSNYLLILRQIDGGVDLAQASTHQDFLLKNAALTSNDIAGEAEYINSNSSIFGKFLIRGEIRFFFILSIKPFFINNICLYNAKLALTRESIYNNSYALDKTFNSAGSYYVKFYDYSGLDQKVMTIDVRDSMFNPFSIQL